MIFREAVDDDIEAMQEVRLSVLENKISYPNLLPASLYHHYLNEIGKGWVCEDAGYIVGFSVACLKDGTIWALFVKPGWEGRGAGKRLLEKATRWLFENGVAEVSLGTAPALAPTGFTGCRGGREGE